MLTMTVNQCRSSCADTVNDVNTCIDVDCLCTKSNGKQLKKCVDCLVKADGTAAGTAVGQDVLDSKLLNFFRPT